MKGKGRWGQGWVAGLTGLVFLASAGVVTLPSSPARAGDDGAHAEAGDRYLDAALRYVKRKKYAKALTFFEKALPHMNQSSDIFYNLVSVTEVQRSWASMLLYASGFLFLEPDSEDAKAIEKKAKSAIKFLTKGNKVPAQVTFQVEPEGIEIFVNHVPIARSGGRPIKLAPGTYTARATHRDYKPWQKTFTVQSGSPMDVTGALKKKIYFGKLKIVTEPADGVTVLIDGKKIGVTPLEDDRRMKTGRYLVRFEKPKYDFWHRYVDIEKDQTYELQPVMERTPPPASRR